MLRLDATKMILSHLKDEVVISNLGPTTDELWMAGHRDRNFYTYGSMGLCSSMALGMALSTDEKIISLDGDGSLLMNMGALGHDSPGEAQKPDRHLLGHRGVGPDRPPEDSHRLFHRP